MGLNFRKSIQLIPGVKLNLSKSGASISAGVPGFRKSINTQGQVTTTASIPGTGLYYTDKKKAFGKDAKTAKKAAEKKTTKKSTSTAEKKTTTKKAASSTEKKTAAKTTAEKSTAKKTAASSQTAPVSEPQQTAPVYTNVGQVDAASLKSIHKTADDTIDWKAVAASAKAPDASCSQVMWAYYHSVAADVLKGDIDTYLQLIYEVNPLDDLLGYGSNFEFGTDNPRKMEVEFTVNRELLSHASQTMSSFEYNDLLQDFVCSLSIRVARDMFALLPVQNVMVHAVLDGNTVLSVRFDRDNLAKVKFGMIDPSDTVSKFTHSMSFDRMRGFLPVSRLL
ncbi:MAG: DUF4236 domain-containing protein [Ruminococcus sp.]|nr:DUF4236 domain-containing protein [Ruminococcus sp.]